MGNLLSLVVSKTLKIYKCSFFLQKHKFYCKEEVLYCAIADTGNVVQEHIKIQENSNRKKRWDYWLNLT